MANSGPLSDLSYRNYDSSPVAKGGRWKVIARNHIMRMFKLKSYWILMVLSGIHFLILAAATYFIDSFAGNMGGEKFAETFFGRIVWRDQFMSGFQVGHFLLMAILLLVGAGAIANDNRSNALLVYLSKPCTKRDYLFGKFAGIFSLFFTALAIPAAFFYFYGMMNYREHGFISDDPFMGVKILLALVLVSAYQASIILGISSLFNQGRLAGATYAGLYVMSGLFAGLPSVIGNANDVSAGVQQMLDKIHYLSIFGGCEAIYKTVLQTNGSFAMQDRSSEMLVARPEVWLLLLVTVVPVGLAWMAAIRKVRAVEVVK
ncbi:MAG: ABC transporter permease subunit [Fimbriimonadaceae bacterium]|nr:MAG: ABC transporter permease subunit [Fimbriimonadaceae bacterium]